MSCVNYANITGWGKCVPSATLTNNEISTFMDTSDEWIFSRTGIKQRHISHVNTSVLATYAAKQTLACAGLKASDLDLIILATATPDTLVPNAACAVQYNLGATCPVFDLNAACSGFLYGLGMASSLIKANQHKRVLIIGAERTTFYLDWKKRDTAVLFGDGAGAVIVEASTDEIGVLGYELNNDASGKDILKTGFGTQMDRYDSNSLSSLTMDFDGQEIFKRAIKEMATLNLKLIKKCNFTKNDIDLLIPHQANERIIDTLVHKLGFDPSKVFINIANYGNTSAATIPIALCDALDKNLIKPNMNILTCAFGAGLSSASLLFRFGNRITPIDITAEKLPPSLQTGLELIVKGIA